MELTSPKIYGSLHLSWGGAIFQISSQTQMLRQVKMIYQLVGIGVTYSKFEVILRFSDTTILSTISYDKTKLLN